jgi:hypothetical protein
MQKPLIGNVKPSSAPHILLFQFGPVHEELAPPLISASNVAGYSVIASLHAGSKLTKGDVFSALSTEDLEKHRILYRDRSLTVDQLFDHILQTAENAQTEHIVFLTLQDPWSVSLAGRVQAAGLRVHGVIHNVNKLKENTGVLRFWSQQNATPIALAPHVAEAVAGLLSRKEDTIPVLSSVFSPSERFLRRTRASNPPRINIGITGGVNYANRPFPLLIAQYAALQKEDPKLAALLTFKILGGGKDLKRLGQDVSSAGLENHFSLPQLSGGMLRSSYESYFQQLRTCDYILCLEKPGYLSHKITSAIPSAISFCKPLVCSHALAKTYETGSMSIAGDNLSSALMRTALGSEHARCSAGAEALKYSAIESADHVVGVVGGTLGHDGALGYRNNRLRQMNLNTRVTGKLLKAQRYFINATARNPHTIGGHDCRHAGVESKRLAGGNAGVQCVNGNNVFELLGHPG